MESSPVKMRIRFLNLIYSRGVYVCVYMYTHTYVWRDGEIRRENYKLKNCENNGNGNYTYSPSRQWQKAEIYLADHSLF